MSCFILSDRHISALAQYALSPSRRERVFACMGCATYDPRTGEDYDPQTLGAILQRENVASWNARYPRDPAEPAFRFVRATELSPVEIIKAVDCYEYQSCEHDGWQKSDAKKIVKAIRKHAIAELPGYEQASWGIE